LPRDPWDSAVQFRDELIRKSFPATSGFEATYRFTIEERLSAHLEIVIERPDLYSVSCNGQTLQPATGKWWLDKAFGRIDLSGVARVGENQVRIKASPFTIWHEVESAYLLGDFSLKQTPKGFAILPAQPLREGPWNAQGHPFYSAGVSYKQR